MSPEEQAMAAKIAHLTSKINQAKTDSSQSTSISGQGYGYHGGAYNGSSYHLQGYSQYPYPPRGVYAPRGRGRGARAPTFRNRSLVLNGTSTPILTDGANTPVDDKTDLSTPISATGSTWISKQDRSSRQLINSAVFQENNEKLAKAKEETRQQKLKQKDDREKAKVMKYLQGVAHSSSGSYSSGAKSNIECNIQGLRFKAIQGGSKLVRISVTCLPRTDSATAAKATPRSAVIGDVRYFRSKNGNLYRSGRIKAYRYGISFYQRTRGPNGVHTDGCHLRNAGIVKKINEPCRSFTTTGTPFHYQAILDMLTQIERATKVEANIYSFPGSCPKGPQCRYIHDPSKVAVCRDFLQKGSCPSGDTCDLSHELTPERTPTCMHFSKGNCSNPNCRYEHIRVSPNALVCRPFGIYGYCEKGVDCTERHLHECPDFSNTGSCSTKGCKLLHRHKASVMRSNTIRNEQIGEAEPSDISSDEEGIDSDDVDVDSDDLDGEFFDDGKTDSDVPMQQDYIQF